VQGRCHGIDGFTLVKNHRPGLDQILRIPVRNESVFCSEVEEVENANEANHNNG
jgi:hypothetical protein